MLFVTAANQRFWTDRTADPINMDQWIDVPPDNVHTDNNLGDLRIPRLLPVGCRARTWAVASWQLPIQSLIQDKEATSKILQGYS